MLLSDANVLIDLGYVNGLQILTQLGQVEVLDVVLEECKHPRQPTLVDDIYQAGIQVVTVQREWTALARPYQTRALSFQDGLCLYYAKTFQRSLLTNENPLRQCCQQQQVLVHGTLWIVRSAYNQGLSPSASLCEWLTILSERNRRLPKKEVAALRRLMGC
jgi:predicted nucleic acid-binding protein